MTTDRQRELTEQAEQANEQGKQEQADELRLLASYGADEEEADELVSRDAAFSGLLLADVEEDDINFLWHNWFPIGCVTLLVGLGDLGKSTIMADIMARVTRMVTLPDGTQEPEHMPDGTLCETPGGAVIVAMEEKTSSVVRPRLRKAGADLTRVIDLSKVQRSVISLGDPAASPFMLPDDLPILERAVKRINASLVVIDCLMSAVNPRVSTFRNQSARQVVTTFQDMAERLGIAVVIINHFTKGSQKDPLTAMAGSKGFSDVVRSVVMLSADASDPKRRVLSLIKHNLGPSVPQIVVEHDGSHVKYLTGVTVEQERINEADALSQSRKMVLAMLSDSPGREFTPTELSQRAEVHYDSMKSVLRRMAADKQITRTSHGFYRALPVKTLAPTAPSAPLEDAPTTILAPTNGHSDRTVPMR